MAHSVDGRCVTGQKPSLVKKLLLVTSSWLIVDSSNSLMCSWGRFFFARYLTGRMSAHLFTETDDRTQKSVALIWSMGPEK